MADTETRDLVIEVLTRQEEMCKKLDKYCTDTQLNEST